LSDRDRSGSQGDRPAAASSGETPAASVAGGAASAATAKAKPWTIDANLQAHIGRHLRALYDDIVNQPVPERFVRLLEELEHKQGDRE
jgi:hypothetical protein